MLGGLWLAVSSWLLGYATDHVAWLNEFVSGLLLIVLCVRAGGVRVSRLRPASLTKSGSAAARIPNSALES